MLSQRQCQKRLEGKEEEGEPLRTCCWMVRWNSQHKQETQLDLQNVGGGGDARITKMTNPR